MSDVLATHARALSTAFGGVRPKIHACDTDARAAGFQVDGSQRPERSAVLLGASYMQELFAEGIDAAIGGTWIGKTKMIGVLAHEFGHAFQLIAPYSVKLRSDGGSEYVGEPCFARLAPPALELHADFMSGWYIGRYGLLSQEAMDAFTMHLFTRGDREFWAASHHGTPSARVTMMNTGFMLGWKRGEIAYPGAIDLGIRGDDARAASIAAVITLNDLGYGFYEVLSGED